MRPVRISRPIRGIPKRGSRGPKLDILPEVAGSIWMHLRIPFPRRRFQMGAGRLPPRRDSRAVPQPVYAVDLVGRQLTVLPTVFEPMFFMWHGLSWYIIAMLSRLLPVWCGLRVQLILLIVGATVLLMIPLPLDAVADRWPALANEVENLGHPLLFLAIAGIGYRILRARWTYPSVVTQLLVFFGSAAFGLATEILQGIVGRDASWIDFGNDLLGAAMALMLHGLRERRSAIGQVRYPRVLPLALIVTGVLATGPFLWTVMAYGHRALKEPVVWEPGSRLFMRFAKWQTGEYPGLNIREPLPDWSSYSALNVVLRNLQDNRLRIYVRINDQESDGTDEDHYLGSVWLEPRSAGTLRIALESLRKVPRGRQMDMNDIKQVVLYETMPGDLPGFQVVKIQLE